MGKTLLEWNSMLETGIQVIDSQHKKLVDILNRLFSAYSNNIHKTEIRKIVGELKDYTIYHFQTEEKYFKEFDYIKTSEHIIEHKKFVDKIEEVEQKFLKLESVLTLKLMIFLQDWVINHIANSDKKYVDCFKENGVS